MNNDDPKLVQEKEADNDNNIGYRPQGTITRKLTHRLRCASLKIIVHISVYIDVSMMS